MNPVWPAAVLRLEVAPDALPAIAGAPALQALQVGEPACTQRTLEYWDTPDLQLARAGIALRVEREAGESWQQLTDEAAERTFASACGEARPSLELAIAGGWKAKRSLRALQPRLVRVFCVVSSRTATTVTFVEGTVARLSLERSRLAAGEREPQEHAAVELACERGDVRRLYELAYDLVGDVPGCRVTTDSATRWRYALATGYRAPARNAAAIDAARKDSQATLARLAVREALAHAASNVDGARNGNDPEYVHQMRVGVRRMRVADRIARHAGLPTFSPRFRKELDWLWDLLGEARDREVFAHDTWPLLLASAGMATGDVAAAHHRVEAARRRAREQVREALASARFQRLLLTAAWILAHQEAAASVVPRRSARALARKLLRRSHRRVVRKGEHVDRLTPGERHALRREAKKLRYLAAFAAPLYDRNQARRFLARLNRLQDVLGTLNDCVVATALVREALAGVPEAARRQWGGNLRRSASALEDVALAGLGAAWAELERTRPFWRDA